VRIFIDKYILMKYKANVIMQLEQMDAIANRIQFQVNRGYDQTQILESIEMLKEQIEKAREMVSLEDDNFAKQFSGL
jgi:DNA-binding transcriptional regulator YiaG